MSNYSLIDPEKRLMLQKELQATDDELKTLEKLIEIQKEKIHSTGGSRNQPSLVIDKFLYLGDLGHAIDANLLLDLSIDNILNVCDCQLDEEISRIRNVKWIETLDDHPQANIREKFDETNAFLLECKKKNEKVLVHCQQGISRSSSIVLAYLMKLVLFSHLIIQLLVCFFFHS